MNNEKKRTSNRDAYLRIEPGDEIMFLQDEYNKEVGETEIVDTVTEDERGVKIVSATTGLWYYVQNAVVVKKANLDGVIKKTDVFEFFVSSQATARQYMNEDYKVHIEINRRSILRFLDQLGIKGDFFAYLSTLTNNRGVL